MTIKRAVYQCLATACKQKWMQNPNKVSCPKCGGNAVLWVNYHSDWND